MTRRETSDNAEQLKKELTFKEPSTDMGKDMCPRTLYRILLLIEGLRYEQTSAVTKLDTLERILHENLDRLDKEMASWGKERGYDSR